MDEPSLLSRGYRLTQTDADVLVLCREDGSFVAAFSAWGATEQAIRRTAEEDRALEERPGERRSA
jgi:hypothetical protein